MTRASDALRDQTEHGRPYRYSLSISYDDPKMAAAVTPRCACGCGRRLPKEPTVVDGRNYVGDHALTVTGDRGSA
jgi:hypothetical protein